MSIVGYIGAGIGVLIIFLIYGYIYIMTSKKKKNKKNWIINLIESWGREKCVMCGNATAYAKKTPTIQRAGYKEGAGQLCSNCNDNIYPRSAAEI